MRKSLGYGRCCTNDDCEVTEKCTEEGICVRRLCSPRLTRNANGNIVTKTGQNNQASYEIGVTANFVCKTGYYNPKNWHQVEEVVICQNTDENQSQTWQPIDGSKLVPCVKGIFYGAYLSILQYHTPKS